MRVTGSEIEIKFTVREAQSLLIVLRRVNASAPPVLQGIPDGVKDDMQGLRLGLENLLRMDE